MQIILQRAQIARSFFFPAVVQKSPKGRDHRIAGIFVVLLRLAENHLGNAPALVVNRLTLVQVVAPRLGETVVVDDLVRILQPIQKGLAALAVSTYMQFTGRHFLGCQTTVLLCARSLYPFTHPQITHVAKGDTEDIEVLGRVL